MKRKISKKVTAALAAVNLLLASSLTAFASGGNFQGSTIATGVKKLLDDILAWATPLVVVIGAIFIVYFSIRRGQSDEGEKRRWENRIISAIVCTVIGTLATSFLSMFMGYFQ